MNSNPEIRPEAVPIEEVDPVEPGLQELLARLKRESTPEKVQLMHYWLSLRENGAADYRRFDPLDVPNLLRNLAVVEVEHPGPRFRFRLYGTRIAEIRGKDLTGQYIGDPGVFPPDLNRIYRQSYVEVLESGQPLFSIVPYELDRRSVGNYHRLLLPFTDSRRGGRTCDFILLSFQSVPLDRN